MAASLLFLMLATSWVPTSAQSNDPIVLSLSTVGDSRQDPTNPDPTTLPLSGQDQIWLQNTKAWSRIGDALKSLASKLSDNPRLAGGMDLMVGMSLLQVAIDGLSPVSSDSRELGQQLREKHSSDVRERVRADQPNRMQER
jgi:hypothetical protein